MHERSADVHMYVFLLESEVEEKYCVLEWEEVNIVVQ